MNSKYKGIFYIITAAFFLCAHEPVRAACRGSSLGAKSFFRNLVAVAAAAVVLARSRPALHLNRGDWGYLFLRAAFGTVGVLCNFTPSTISCWLTPPC